MHTATDHIVRALHDRGLLLVVTPAQSALDDEVVKVLGHDRYLVVESNGLTYVNSPAPKGCDLTLWCEFIRPGDKLLEDQARKLKELLQFFSTDTGVALKLSCPASEATAELKH